MSKTSYFSADLFRFLKELKTNNNREWFQANKERYIRSVRDPLLRFITDLSPRLKKISGRITVDPHPTRGSMFRIYRDTRFAADKSPYKTHAAAHFWHEKAGKSAHSPGYYLHLEPGGCYTGAGLWHPDTPALTSIRKSIVAKEREWKSLRKKLNVQGERLSRPPKGFSTDHPLIEDLKLKDFVTSIRFTEAQVCSETFLVDFIQACKQMYPLIKFLTVAMKLPI